MPVGRDLRLDSGGFLPGMSATLRRPPEVPLVEAPHHELPIFEAARDALPLYAPHSAVDIRIRSMRESSAGWLSFHAPMPDIATMLRSCARVAENAVEYTRHPPPRWWPTVLAAGEKKGDPQYEYYRCEQWPGTGRFHARRFTAVDPKHGQVFEWQLD